MAEITNLMRKDRTAPETARERANRLMHEAEAAAGDVFAEAIAAAEEAMIRCAEVGRMRSDQYGVKEELRRIADDIERHMAVIKSMRARS